jgi:aryl-alcohol dehydrogenase-like predicted oxidoreductase
MGGAHWSLWEERDDEQSIRTINAGIDAGINFIDTAHRYTYANDTNHNEWLIKKALDAGGWSSPVKASDIVVATKGGHFYLDGDGPIDGRPETLRRHAELSLKTLGVETLDLYYLHWPDPNVPIVDSMGEIEAMRLEGKIRNVGVSNCDRDQLDQAITVSPVTALQNLFNPGHQSPEELDLIKYTNQLGIAYVPYSPLGGTFPPTPLKPMDPQLVELAAQAGVSVPVLVLNWHLSLSPNIIPLVGSRRPESITDSARVMTANIPAEITVEVAKLLTH